MKKYQRKGTVTSHNNIHNLHRSRHKHKYAHQHKMLCTLCMVKDAVISDRLATAIASVKALCTRGNKLCATVLAAYSFDTWLYGSADYHPNVITTENFTITDITSRWAGIHTTRFHCRYKELRRQKYHWDWKPFIIECHYGSHHPGYDLQARHWADRFTAITEPAFLQLKDVHLYRPEQQPLKVLQLGTAHPQSWKGLLHVWTHKVYIVRDLEQNMLGLPAIAQSLG